MQGQLLVALLQCTIKYGVPCHPLQAQLTLGCMGAAMSLGTARYAAKHCHSRAADAQTGGRRDYDAGQKMLQVVPTVAKLM
jgi:hypothetical protein